MTNLPTLRQLHYLSALADRNSFVRAAEHCHVTQSTLSAGIAALENVLGHALIDRTNRNPVVLTPLGRDVVAAGRLLLRGAEDLVARARRLDEPMRGPLRLGIIPTIAPYFLPQALPFLQRDFPRLEIQLHEDQSARLVTALHGGDLDLALLAFPYDTGDLATAVLFSENFVLACRKKTRKDSRKVMIDELRGQPLLLLDEGHCLRDQALAACKLQSRDARRTFSATSLPTLIEMVRHGYGITLLPEMAVRETSLPKGIDIFLFKDPVPGREIGLAWRAGHSREPEYRLLAKTLRKARLPQTPPKNNTPDRPDRDPGCFSEGGF